GRRRCSRPTSPACSPSATCGAARSSGSPRRSARGRPRSSSSTRTCRSWPRPAWMGARQALAPVSMRNTVTRMRVLLVFAAVLVFLAGLQLFGFSLRTKDFFAWTVANPLTAAFFGANFWGACVIEALGARERLWVNARIAVWPVFIYTTAMLAVSLAYLGQVHLGPAFATH